MLDSMVALYFTVSMNSLALGFKGHSLFGYILH